MSEEGDKTPFSLKQPYRGPFRINEETDRPSFSNVFAANECGDAATIHGPYEESRGTVVVLRIDSTLYVVGSGAWDPRSLNCLEGRLEGGAR